MPYLNATAAAGATLVVAMAVTLTATPLHGRTLKPVVVTGEETGLVTRHVAFADLNLGSTAGERALKQRVGVAVQGACTEAVGRSDIWLMHYCSVDAWQEARPQIARAVQRARDIAFTGTSTISAATAITFAIGN